MAKQSGGPAFPVTVTNEARTPTCGLNNDEVVGGTAKIYGGMTVRDYFAAKALVIVASAGGIDHIGPAECASAAYEIADAMLAERDK